MKADTPADDVIKRHELAQDLLDAFGDLYDSNIFAQYGTEPKIPLSLHYFKATDTLPVMQTFYIEMCSGINPNFTVTVWSDSEEDLAKLSDFDKAIYS